MQETVDLLIDRIVILRVAKERTDRELVVLKDLVQQIQRKIFSADERIQGPGIGTPVPATNEAILDRLDEMIMRIGELTKQLAKANSNIPVTPIMPPYKEGF